MLPREIFQKVVFSLMILVVCSSKAFAADGALLLFKDGQEARLRDGYKQLMSAMRELKDSGANSHVIEINLDGNSFFIDTAQLAVVCRQPCRSFEVVKKKN